MENGWFALVRNPFSTAMITAALGVALVVPTVIALAAFAAILVAVELHVRLVEEPYLLRTHGEADSAYAARVGRFVPAVGRLRRNRRQNRRDHA